jgi:hypothetical protein
MALRMHPVSPSRWQQLAATRLPIDLTETAEVKHRPGGKREREHARIQEYVDALGPQRASASR